MLLSGPRAVKSRQPSCESCRKARKRRFVMTQVSDVLRAVVVSMAVSMVVAWPGVTEAAKKKAATPPPAAAHNKPNACGCYKDPGGACMCGKKGKCGCPGDCEPRGCEEKRAKDMEREIKAETKRAQEADKRQKASSAKHKDEDGDRKGAEKAPAKKSDSSKE